MAKEKEAKLGTGVPDSMEMVNAVPLSGFVEDEYGFIMENVARCELAGEQLIILYTKGLRNTRKESVLPGRRQKRYNRK